MWTLIGFTCLVIAALIVLLWDYGPGVQEHSAEAGAPASPIEPTTQAASHASGRTLTYTISRWDFSASCISFFFRHRAFHVLILLGLVVLELAILNDVRPQSWLEFLFFSAAVLLAFFVTIAITLVAVILVTAYLFKYPGIIGPHTLTITEQIGR